MKRFYLFFTASTLMFLPQITLSQAPVMSSWVSAQGNETEIQFRMHDRSINEGYALCEVSFSMSAARCALTDEVAIYIHENDGSGTYGTQRYMVSFNPGPGTVPVSTTQATRILISSTGSTEPVYARMVAKGVSSSDNFELSTANVNTTIVTGDAYDPNENSATASSIARGVTTEGLVLNDDADWYEFTLASRLELIVTMEYLNDYRTDEANLDLDLFVARSTGSPIYESISSAVSTTGFITETIDEVMDPGTYYLVVLPKGSDPGRNFYQLTWNYYTPPNYQISGTISDEQNHRIEGVTLEGLPGNPVTDEDGHYGLVVQMSWSGTVTPTLAGYTFSPASRTYTDVREAHASDNYTATLDEFTISGRITDGLGTGEPGITLSGFPETVVSDAGGYYSGTVPYNWSGTIIPGATGLVFSPASYVYSGVTASVTDQDFTSSVRTYEISGNVISSTGTQLEGVSMAGFPESVLTNQTGVYVAQVEHGWSGTVTPVLAGYTFNPSETVYSNVTAAQSQNYTAIPDPYLNLNQHIIILGAEDGASSVVNVSSNVDWTVTCPENWITCSPESGSDNGSFTVTVNSANSGTGERDALITVSGGGISQNIDLTQAGSDPFLELSSASITLGAASASSLSVDITSNIDWSITETADWLSVTVLSGSGSASVTLTADLENESTNPRSTTVTVSGGDLSRDLVVTQSAADLLLEVSTSSVTLGSAASSTQSVDIASNIVWTVSESSEWLSVDPASGSGDGVLTLTTDLANDGVDSRSANVVVTGSGFTRDIEVTQTGADPALVVSASTVTLGSAVSSSQTVEISSNLEWTVTETVDWLSVAPLSGSGSGSLLLTTDLPNESADSRNTTVIISGGGLSWSLVVTQEGKINTGIGDPSALPEMILYPNPTGDHVYVESTMTLQEKVFIKILGPGGKVLRQWQLPGMIPNVPLRIDLSDLAVGEYFMQLSNDSFRNVYKILKTQ